VRKPACARSGRGGRGASCLDPKQKSLWLAEGISRSTWYRRQKKAREQAAAEVAAMMRQAALDRLEWQITQLRADLETAARYANESAVMLDELAAICYRMRWPAI
jgi:hypothetical protein